MLERQQHGCRLERPGGAEGVTGHALDRCDRRSGFPKTLRMASASAASLRGVDVP